LHWDLIFILVGKEIIGRVGSNRNFLGIVASFCAPFH